MGDLDALMEQTTAVMSGLIAKPKMTAKLLSKPPFRFLHDTITAIITTTGFGEGLYAAAEMDSANIADKDAKVAYLNKIFQLVGICKVPLPLSYTERFYYIN
jgi:TRAF3-interacting protein 1